MLQSQDDSMLSKFEAAIETAQAQIRRVIDGAPDRFPLFTSRGEWRFTEEVNPLAMGCFTGMIWDLYELTRDEYWRGQGERYCRLIDSLGIEESGPGVGMAYFFGGHMRWYQASVQAGLPETEIRERLIRIGKAQAGSFVPSGGYLASAGQPSLVCIERIVDVPSILFAANETQEPELFDVAARHCATTRKYLVRGDGSVVSGVIVDAGSGRCLGPVARAGQRADSTWACGQGWAILGFATAGGLLGFEPWLQTARQSAQVLVEKLSGDAVPLWDLDAPTGSSAVRDSAAAAVAAAGLLQLADAEQTIGADQARVRRHLQDLALHILVELCSPDYLAAGESEAGLLKHGVGNLPAAWAVDESVIWGDAFLVRALCRALRLVRPRGG